MANGQKHFVELNSAENNLLKTAFMVAAGALGGRQTEVFVGLLAFKGFLDEMGPEGLRQLTLKMQAHADQTQGDGSLAVLEG